MHRRWTAAIGAGLFIGVGIVGAQPTNDRMSGRMDDTADRVVAQDTPVVVLETTMGTMVLELYPWKAPISVENFLRYVESGFYSGLIFHRVMRGFVVQAGGYTRSMSKRSTLPPIENESTNGLSNKRGTVALARLPDPHSATSQFYINLSDNSSLDFKNPRDGWGYAVFGRVREGMEVADAISKVETGVVRGKSDVPLEPVVIRRATLMED